MQFICGGFVLKRKVVFSFLWFLGLGISFLNIPAHAQAPGDACSVSGAYMTSSAGGVVNKMMCNGSNWIGIVEYDADGRTLLQVGNDTGACTSAKAGRLRYADDTDIWEYCNGVVWGALAMAPVL